MSNTASQKLVDYVKDRLIAKSVALAKWKKARPELFPDSQIRARDVLPGENWIFPLVPPIIEIALHCGERRKVLGQQAPLAAASCDMQDRVDNGAQVGFPRTAQMLECRHTRFDQPPLRIGKVACVTPPSSLILRTSDFDAHVVRAGPGDRRGLRFRAG